MAINIGVNELRDTINGILEECGDEAIGAIETATKKTSQKVVKDLRKGGSYNGGKEFNKGWTAKTDTTRNGLNAVVYNKTKPGLAHLLEFGHAKQNGGRTKAFNFIAPVADAVEDDFVEAFERAMTQ
jgi:hypothetical protein